MLFQTNPFLQKKTPQTDQNLFTDVLQTVTIALSICTFIYLFIATPNEVHGKSMEPNFHDNELLVTYKTLQFLGNTKLGNITGDYRRGDVVIFKHILSQEDFIKRIIAVGGDSIVIKNGAVSVNNIELQETYLAEGMRTEVGNFLIEGQVVKVPADSYVVLGDNRGNSTDSRSKLVGFVQRNQLKGKVIFKSWPIDSFGPIHRHHYKELDTY